MKTVNGKFQLSATDLVGHLSCRHLSSLNRAVTEGKAEKPKVWHDPLLEALWERGLTHEKNYVEHLEAQGLEPARIEGVDVSVEAVEATRAAMSDGAQVIVQGALADDLWVGRVDVLRRVDVKSDLGPWSFEAVDTKLARETKAGAILQLAVYSDLIAQVQGRQPDLMHVITPWAAFEPESFRVADFAAYTRSIKSSLSEAITSDGDGLTYPEPTPHCDICRWRDDCDNRRRADDHLCLVAGISKLQITELTEQGFGTASALAAMPIPLAWKPERGSRESLERVREQARVQVEARLTGENKVERQLVEQGFGLTRLPKPSSGDVFLDLEGDPFVDEHGLEYLFGYLFQPGDGEATYVGQWALNREEEKAAFENFVDFVIARWEEHPDLHVYHYGGYEPGAMKRLMGRYATREEEIDSMLRAGLFVDLLAVVRQGILASVESYSIKRLEPFYGFERETPLQDANRALGELQAHLELNDVEVITDEAKGIVRSYNKDDCASTIALRDWLETHRDALIDEGYEIQRPGPTPPAPSEALSDWQERINSLVERLTEDVPIDVEERTTEEQACWLLAHLLDWHRREEKASWWEYFRLADLPAIDLIDEKAAISGLQFKEEVPSGGNLPVHRYSFPVQDTDVRSGDTLKKVGGENLGTVVDVSLEDLTVDIKKRGDTADLHPEAVFAHSMVNSKILAEALVDLGEFVADNGISGEGDYAAARDLLLRERPKIGGADIRLPDETVVDAALRLATLIEGGVLPVQGPPGSGKTYTGARLICRLVQEGKKVGITANSHKVIRNLLDGVVEAAEEMGVDIRCAQKPAEMEPDTDHLIFVKNNATLDQEIAGGCHVAGGTAWYWSRPASMGSVDVLVIDEAAQMSLANVLSVSRAANALILLGDPQQLDQPMQGSHPDGTAVSALDHIRGDHKTIAPDQGLFLEETWRLHPEICAFTSELFYDGRLQSHVGMENQRVNSEGQLDGYGLHYLPILHSGNHNSSPEEAKAITKLVEAVVQEGATWTDAEGANRPLGLNDILIITPYNAQVFELQKHLPGARIGTVDKFQGQEAPVAIYSTATSSRADAPRGMEFLYSLNRLNVAISRARCISLLVASPAIFEADCRTPQQMKLANAFCRYIELAGPISC